MFKSNTKQYEHYAHGMRGRGWGYAFLDPPSNVDAYPGVCGFINENGLWVKICDLFNEKELKELKFGEFSTKSRELAEEQGKLGPLETNTIGRISLSAEAAAAVPGMPAKLGSVARYELQGEYGGILVCHDDVKLRRYMVKDPFRKWAKDNAKLVINKFEDVKKNGGFYVITSTREASEIRITCWGGRGQSVVIGISSEVDGAGKLSADAQVYVGESISGWHAPICKEGESKVPFFGGVRIDYHKLWPTTEKDESKWSGYRGDDGKFMVEDDEYVYDVAITTV
ncbi:unnamed protein product [Clonostachys chloroleuca]|uniref:Uncharacterized protein n=1 Tax=Clonostachys chloroleuca TaxID=1926264 RepID=A0AA35LQH6_9HYPO|nr:unnamed protein product [Clonostachys chloroleuca]